MRGFYLPDALRWAGHRVFHATVLADGPPELCISAILLQGVGSFVHEIVVDRRVSDRAIVHVHLMSQVLECPGGWQNHVRTKTFLRIDDFNIIQVY